MGLPLSPDRQPCERHHTSGNLSHSGVSISPKAMGALFTCRITFCVFNFLKFWVVGELPGEKSRYDAIRKNQREE